MTVQISIVLYLLPSKEYELIPDFTVPLTSDLSINIFCLVHNLKKLGFPIDNNQIYYYSPVSGMYIYCGFDPVPTYSVIYQEDFSLSKQIQLKCKNVKKSMIHQIMNDEMQQQHSNNIRKMHLDEEEDDYSNDEDENNLETDQQQQFQQNGDANNVALQCKAQKTKNPSQIKCRRTKERKIGFIIEKVSHWRKFYTGGDKLSLEEAALRVGISKKSLDDYLLQIRLGRKYGFNFNEHNQDKVGILRSYVKKYRALVGQVKQEAVHIKQDSEGDQAVADIDNHQFTNDDDDDDECIDDELDLNKSKILKKKIMKEKSDSAKVLNQKQKKESAKIKKQNKINQKKQSKKQ